MKRFQKLYLPIWAILLAISMLLTACGEDQAPNIAPSTASPTTSATLPPQETTTPTQTHPTEVTVPAPPTEPTAPPVSVPSEPTASEPTAPPTAESTTPSTTEPTAPPVSVPTEPTVSAPTAPPAVESTTPSTTEPTAPPVSIPTEPTVSAPTAPPTEESTTPPITEPTIAVCVHTYEETIVNATCTAEGSKTYFCQKCGDGYKEVISRTPHNYADATCTSPKICNGCGKTDGKALGHTHQLTNVTAATCTAEGVKTYSCPCGNSYTESISKIPHNYANPTCTSPKTCKACGKTDGTVIPHSYQLTHTQSAGCTSERIETYRCACGDSYTKTLPPISAEHSWVTQKCTTWIVCSVCGATEDGGGTAVHDWLDATCDRSRTCQLCGRSDGEPLGHDYRYVGCNSWQQCTRCQNFGGQLLWHQWNDNHICTLCSMLHCEEYGHYYFYNRCYYCGMYDEESTALAKELVDRIITPGMSEFEKVLAIHDYIINNTSYDYDNYLTGTIPDSSYSPMGVFVYGKAVCQGYAYAFELCCQLSGIDCVLVTGFANGGGHAWNQVKVDGKWYNIDVTWDDPIASWGPILCYDYFLISDSLIYQDHVAENAKYVCDESYPRNT